MKDGSGNPPQAPPLSLRAEGTAYAAAFLSISIQPMANVVVPLWALALGVPPLLFGIAMGARSLLPFLFSIHGGVLIDRLGTRRVMIWCAAACAVLSLLYPALPWVGPLIALQIGVGMLTSMGWIGAQTQIAQLTRGHPLYMGRFTFISTIANFIGPFAVGVAWDAGGAWAAFGLMAAWGAVLAAGCATMPVPAGVTLPNGRPTLSELMPRLADYRAALALVLVPAVGFVIAASFMMNTTFSMRFAFYVVYLEQVGFQGTLIGVLVGMASLSGAVFALLIGPATRRFDPDRLLIAMIVTAAAGIGATPLFSGVAGLFALACVFGLGTGLGMALIYAELSRSAPVHKVGTSIGLRTTANRASSLLVPVAMGAIVEYAGIAAGFYLMAALVIAGALGGLILLRRRRSAPPLDQTAASPEDGPGEGERRR